MVKLYLVGLLVLSELWQPAAGHMVTETRQFDIIVRKPAFEVSNHVRLLMCSATMTSLNIEILCEARLLYFLYSEQQRHDQPLHETKPSFLVSKPTVNLVLVQTVKNKFSVQTSI